MGSATKDDERRRHARHLACFPAEVAVTGAESTALIRELSVGGALLFTQDAYPVGATLRLTLHLGPDVDEHVEAVVVRQAEEPEHVIWRHSVAVRFERRLDELTDVIESLCERQRHL